MHVHVLVCACVSPHLADKMMTRASSSLASSSRAVKLVSWLNWSTFSAWDLGHRISQTILLTHHLRTETSEPLLLGFACFGVEKRERKRDRVPRESVQRTTKKKGKNLEGGEEGGKNLQFILFFYFLFACKLKVVKAPEKDVHVRGWESK